MARKATKAKVVEKEEFKFMLVWHDKPSTMFIASPRPGDFSDLEIQSGQKVAVADYEQWMRVPHFLRDVEAGVLHTEYSDRVPKTVEHKVGEAWGLNNNQIQVAHVICSTDPLTPQLIENIELHKLIGPTGISRPNIKVTKSYLVTYHRPFLQAVAELEAGWKNRPEVIKMLKAAIEAINNL